MIGSMGVLLPRGFCLPPKRVENAVRGVAGCYRCRSGRTCSFKSTAFMRISRAEAKGKLTCQPDPCRDRYLARRDGARLRSPNKSRQSFGPGCLRLPQNIGPVRDGLTSKRSTAPPVRRKWSRRGKCLTPRSTRSFIADRPRACRTPGPPRYSGGARRRGRRPPRRSPPTESN